MNRMKPKAYWIFFALAMYACGGVEKPEGILEAEKHLPQEIDFNLHVKPILSDKCFACHGPDAASRKAGLRLDNPKDARAALQENPGKHAVVPGSLKKSQLYYRIVSEDPGVVMPPPEFNLSLTDREKAVLTRWIEEGAEYKPHWAFIKPKKPDPPESGEAWARNAIDRFVYAKMQQQGLEPSPEADKETLLRRVTLDLTGLPPTPKDVAAFVADTSPDAYEQMVDRLLASEAYGEQMAVGWMDAARYADTHGYSVDRYRDMSPWRDWVISAFNENMPFDRFVTWQMAGDMLPDATREQILATGFNRNHPQNMEGGIINEEFRVEYVADRTNTLGAALLGLTLECARCHDHKYDPISQKEYYELFSFFNNVDEAGQISWDDMMPVPTLLLPEEEVQEKLDYIQGVMDQQTRQLEAAEASARERFERWKSTFDTAAILRGLDKGLVGYFPFDRVQDNAFVNAVDRTEKATCVDFDLVDGYAGKGFRSNGDDQLRCEKTGVFSRAESFSISLWIHLPDSLHNGVIFHKGEGAILYDFKGYHLALRDDRLEVLMARNWPYNAIIKVSERDVPRNRWVHLVLTYDGLGKAAGLKLYADGLPQDMVVEKDNLYKDILFPALGKEPALTLGARWRGTGTKNAVFDELRVYDRTLTAAEVHMLSGREQADQQDLFEYYLSAEDPEYRKIRQETLQAFGEYNALNETVQEVMVMDEMPEPRQAYVLERGVYAARGDSVFPGTPEAVLPFPEDLPKNRVGLAAWLFHEDNPLTARVMVNRLWQKFFVHGLVKTADDFGNQGEMPTHPALLDWLAVDFRENGWDMKALQKKIVMSATYRQSSIAGDRLRKADPENQWLARGPSARLSAEMLRDNVLKASGLLVEKVGGESVKPYQPPDLWKVNNATYDQDEGEGLYRRSLYTVWKRSVPPPTMNIFDAPTRSTCIVSRQKTTTPLQALALLNDVQFVEAARVLAAKSGAYGKDVATGIAEMFVLLAGREPRSGELQLLEELYDRQLARFRAAPEKVHGWLTAGDSIPDCDDCPEIAAGAVVASTIMNSDATIMKR